MRNMSESKQFDSVWDALTDTPAEAKNLKVRSALIRGIRLRIDRFGWSQSVAANNLGVTQPRISDLMNGKIDKFSIDTLINMAAAVGLSVDVEITVSPDAESASKAADELNPV